MESAGHIGFRERPKRRKSKDLRLHLQVLFPASNPAPTEPNAFRLGIRLTIVLIPTPLRTYVAGHDAVEFDAPTVAGASKPSPGPTPICANISSPPKAGSALLLTCI